MRKLTNFFLLLIGAVRSLYGQPAPPALPAQDYEVYAALINQLVIDAKERLPILSDWVVRPLFIDEYTTRLSSPGFNVDFRDVKEVSFGPRPTIDSLLKKPEWAAFVTSLNADQFPKCRLEKVPPLPAYKASLWTSALNEYYFGKNGLRHGFFGLRDDYPKFVGIVSLSKVAYSPNGQWAICYFSRVSDGEDGEGLLVFLETKSGHWQVIDSILLWIS